MVITNMQNPYVELCKFTRIIYYSKITIISLCKSYMRTNIWTQGYYRISFISLCQFNINDSHKCKCVMSLYDSIMNSQDYDVAISKTVVSVYLSVCRSSAG